MSASMESQRGFAARLIITVVAGLAAGLAAGAAAVCIVGAPAGEDRPPASTGFEPVGDELPEPPALVSDGESNPWQTSEVSEPWEADGEPATEPSGRTPDAPEYPIPEVAFVPAPSAGAEFVALEEADPAVEADVEVLARGPVHEALLEMITASSGEPGDILASEEPPPDVEELPPEDRPAGADVVWIPGYWSWDDDDRRYVWVSGLWRRVPAGCRWVPGYWTNVASGDYRWVGGFWIGTGRTIAYLPEPPESREIEPLWSAPEAPGPDFVWVPGCWERVGNAYVWRSGWWMEARPDWVWVPAHYRWTPHGWIFIPGYWDHPLETRGMFFAPVVFRHIGPGLCYRPAVVIEIRVLLECLFARARDGRHCFGDYFDARYRTRGIHPWFEHREHAEKWLEPALVHCRMRQSRDDKGWEERLRSDYRYRFDHPEARPARKFADKPAASSRQLKIGSRLAEVVRAARPGPDRPGFVRVDSKARGKLAADRKALRDYAESRKKLEAPVRAARMPEPKRIVEAPAPVRRVEPEKPVAAPAPVTRRPEPRKTVEKPVASGRAEPKKSREEPVPARRSEPEKPVAAPAQVVERPEPRKVAEKPAAVVRDEPKKSRAEPVSARRSEPGKPVAAPVPVIERPEPRKAAEKPVAAVRDEPKKSRAEPVPARCSEPGKPAAAPAPVIERPEPRKTAEKPAAAVRDEPKKSREEPVPARRVEPEKPVAAPVPVIERHESRGVREQLDERSGEGQDTPDSSIQRKQDDAKAGAEPSRKIKSGKR